MISPRAPSLARLVAHRAIPTLAVLILFAGCRAAAPPSDRPGPSASDRPTTSATSASSASSIASAPTLDSAATTASTPPASAPSVSASAAIAPGPRILVLGDSHLFGGLTAPLKEALSHGGANPIWIHGSCGSSPLTWNRGVLSLCGAVEDVPGKTPFRTFAPAKTPRIDDLLAAIKPQATLLIMGSNFISSARGQGAPTRELVDHIVAAGSRCAWLGPPRLFVGNELPDDARLARFYTELGHELGDRCALIDSRTIGTRLRGTSDDVHVEPISAAKWGQWAAARFLGDPDPFPPATP